MQRRAQSFIYAFSGLAQILKAEPNAWIHLAAAGLVVAVAIWLQLPRRDWAVLVLTIFMVWMAEATNTALEAIVDLASPEFHHLARRAKDVAAGAVLLSAIGAIIVGLLLLGPPLLEKLTVP
ncbi:MAG: diacylglycerol kinase family protein [Candidatus Promineifilaceae bacterium]|nr:diacylglycerol kinase family protein [Candidatus Promineifilaceae bacterium]